MWTVQAPHSPRSQPFFVPVSAKLFAQRIKERHARFDRQRAGDGR